MVPVLVVPASLPKIRCSVLVNQIISRCSVLVSVAAFINVLISVKIAPDISDLTVFTTAVGTTVLNPHTGVTTVSTSDRPVQEGKV